ncbi:MBL fold metallo-hydrolase [Desulfitobacterium chlororespirans]|uniref:Glyoxylase, beta-lactamase superfamily II n=1 Tax=Desulfitobacterium chlororespirans DSM 11544 TaxID=1121395 RepID=A0A1M7UZ43_9FIRM|nr:MBL fold metallo-hydrolase [Desulfitobacterium chlororespirans]SHN88273.1 Glyoxylase, beta-lactamase superfamily II [Desulfitobacterium chlororespirans DSM 11544]
MIEQVFKDIYKIEIPLPNSPLRATNSYFIKGDSRNLIVDTGFNHPVCKAAMDDALKRLGFSMHNTDLFITHIHSDHSGLAGSLAQPETKVYCGKYCAELLTGQADLAKYGKDYMLQSGLVVNSRLHYDMALNSARVANANPVSDGDSIKVGEFTLRCIDTTGHAPDHMCLYDLERKILFSGDHILESITPNNTIWELPWSVTTDTLGTYLTNLDKIAELEINRVFPGHRGIINDCRQRIDELKIHHAQRLEQIMGIIGGEKMNGAEVAGRMTWNVGKKSWEQFSSFRKILCTGEALAHLSHLVFIKKLKKELLNGVVFYMKE